jgi:hypothetical protein
MLILAHALVACQVLVGLYCALCWIHFAHRTLISALISNSFSLGGSKTYKKDTSFLGAAFWGYRPL